MKSRPNMVRNQVRIVGVENEGILTAMMDIQREDFVDNTHKNIAYSDAELMIDSKRSIARPEMIAQFLEAAQITSDDVVLEAGCGTGYASHIISRLAKNIIGVDSCKKIINKAKSLSNEIHNLSFEYTNFKNIKISQDISLILVNGAVFDKRADLSVIQDKTDLFNFHSGMLIDDLMSKMATNCRLFCVEGYFKYHPMHIVKYTKDSREVLKQVYFPEIRI